MSCCRPPSESSTKLEDAGQSCKQQQDDEKNKNNVKKTILFVPLDCIGHVNSLLSIADSYKHLGHRTVFLFNDPMDGGLKEKGHEVYDCSEDALVESRPTAASERKWDLIVGEMGKLWRSSLMDNFVQTTRVGLGSMMRDIMKHDERVSRKLQLIRPHLIIVDHYFIQPAIIKSQVPWARVYSASPLALHPKCHKLPPATLGLPTDWLSPQTTQSNPKLRLIYESYARQVDEVRGELYEQFNEYLVQELKLDPLPDDPMSYIYLSPHLNVYMYPEELDYVGDAGEGLQVPRGWQRCDSILRLNAASRTQTEPAFELPPELEAAKLGGKLIFLSMGSLASGDVELMKRLIKILAKSPHRFIVSRGANWQQYELAPNMWGQKFVRQLAILPKIDLIITHGGNNTITECFYYGVPGFIVCPVFSDQFDNGQRIEERQLGLRVDPFHCSESQLLEAIEDVLSRQEASIRPRMLAISKRMQRHENKFKGIRLFQDLLDRL